jgi:carbon-monoxide dehydrogenase catalytic subunit
MPSVADLCDCYHTRLISTNDAGRYPDATHLPVTDQVSAARIAREIIEIAMQNRPNRRKEYEDSFNEKRPARQMAVVGHTERSIPTGEIADGIRNRKLKGVIGVVGCAHPRVDCDEWITVFRELSADFIILTTGCMAFEFGRRGLLDGRRIFHLGSCINNARVAQTLLHISRHLNDTVYNLPFIISAPAPVTEKAMSIFLFFAAFGCSIHSGFPYILTGATDIGGYFDNLLSQTTGANAYLEDSPSAFMARVRSDFH